MKTEELVKLLEELVNLDLSDGYLINDHPCSIAIERIRELESSLSVILEWYKEYDIIPKPEIENAKQLLEK